MSPKPRSRAGMDAEAVARMMAQQDEEATSTNEAPAAAPQPEPAPTPEEAREHARADAFDPGKVDGRTLRRTGREPFATRIKPETAADLKRIAHARRITIAEALELAVAAYVKTQASS